MTTAQVGQTFLDLPEAVLEVGYRKGTIIDSGTTLGYLQDTVYEPLVHLQHKISKLVSLLFILFFFILFSLLSLFKYKLY